VQEVQEVQEVPNKQGAHSPSEVWQVQEARVWLQVEVLQSGSEAHRNRGRSRFLPRFDGRNCDNA
jgi:hypothetical protein